MKEIIFALALIYPFTGQSGEYDDAAKKAADAAYKQSGLEENVKTLVDKEADKLPNEIKKIVGYSSPIVNAVITQRIELKYEF